MKHAKFIMAAAFLTMGASGSVLGAGPTDIYDPYVTADEIQAVPSNPTASEMRMSDIYDTYLLPDEVVVSEGCVNPAHALIADSHDAFFTMAELDAAEMMKKC